MNKQLSRKWFYLFTGMIALSMALTGCGKGCKGGGGATGAEAASLKLISSDHNFIVGVNWKKLESSPLGDKMKETMPAELVPLSKSIDGMVLGFDIKGVGQEPENFVAIISGNLDQAALLAELTSKAKENGLEISDTEYNGVKIYSGSKDPTVGLAFIGDKGVVGKKPAVQKAIDLSNDKGDSVEKNQNLMALTKTLDMDRMIWAVGVIPEGAIPGAGGGPGNPMGALSGVKAIDLALDISKDLNLDLGIIAGTPDDAKQMQTMANSYKALFGTSLAKNNPSIGKVLAGLEINADGNRVAISLKLDEATVTELSKEAQAAVPGAAQDAPAPIEGGIVPPPPPAPPKEDS